MRKIIKRIFIIIIALLLLTTVNCFAADDDELNIKELVEAEEGSLFDKTIAKTIRRPCTSCLKYYYK